MSIPCSSREEERLGLRLGRRGRKRSCSVWTSLSNKAHPHLQITIGVTLDWLRFIVLSLFYWHSLSISLNAGMLNVVQRVASNYESMALSPLCVCWTQWHFVPSQGMWDQSASKCLRGTKSFWKLGWLLHKISYATENIKNNANFNYLSLHRAITVTYYLYLCFPIFCFFLWFLLLSHDEWKSVLHPVQIA